jgi:hypothetical protein
VVGFYAGDPDMGGTMLGSGMTKKSLYPAEAEDVKSSRSTMPDPGLLDGSIPVFVVVDDGMPMHLWKECKHQQQQGRGQRILPEAGVRSRFLRGLGRAGRAVPMVQACS